MTEERRKLIQAILAVMLVVAAVRLALIYYERHAGEPAQQQDERKTGATPVLDASYYVVPRKLHAYDLQSAQPLTRQPVWVKEGYRYTYYPYDTARRKVDFTHEAGLLAPLEKLQVTEVMRDGSPSAEYPPQVMAVFDKAGRRYAVPIGQVKGSDYRIFADEVFYIEDPHTLYKWPAEIWQAIDAHQARPGMDEIQAAFALGMGVPRKSEDPRTKTVVYPNGGDPLLITYREGKAFEIQKGSKP